MRKKLIYITTLIIAALIFTTNNVYANTPINPINSTYKEGIYKIDKSDNGTYNLQYQYKNINCNRKCNAGTITNKNTIILITDGEVELDFTKIK